MENQQTPEANVLQKPKNNTLSIGNAIVVAGVLIALSIILTGGSKKEIEPKEVVLDKVSVTDSDHVLGNSEAKIILVEYSDIDCPFCRVFHVTLQKVLEEYPNDVAWVYRDYPLIRLHPEAKAKAISAECIAINEGNEAYFTYLDYLFTNEVKLANLSEAIATLGYNQGKHDTCIAENIATENVDTDMETGEAYGIEGTPFTILVNTETGEALPIRGAVPYEDLKQIIDSELSK